MPFIKYMDGTLDVAETADEHLQTDDAAGACLPYEYRLSGEDGYGGPPVDDPLTLYFDVDPYSEGGLRYRTSLRELVAFIIEGHRPGGYDGEYRLGADARGIVRDIATALRELADWAEAEADKGEPVSAAPEGVSEPPHCSPSVPWS